MGTHLRVLSESFLMNTNMAGFRWFSKIVASLHLDESSLTAVEGLNISLTKPSSNRV